jgi:hypothetical protein
MISEVFQGAAMQNKFVKFFCLFFYLITSIQAYALGPVSSLTAEEFEDIESGVAAAIVGFRQACVGPTGLSVMPEITTGQVTVSSVSNSIPDVGFSGGTWTFNTGWLAFTNASATGVTINMPADSNVIMGQAYVTAIKLRVIPVDANTACPTSITACTSALGNMNTAISAAWTGKLGGTDVVSAITVDCTPIPVNGGGGGALSDADYVPVGLPQLSVNDPGSRDLIPY